MIRGLFDDLLLVLDEDDDLCIPIFGKEGRVNSKRGGAVRKKKESK